LNLAGFNKKISGLKKKKKKIDSPHPTPPTPLNSFKGILAVFLGIF